jgi:hypothetical protein
MRPRNGICLYLYKNEGCFLSLMRDTFVPVLIILIPEFLLLLLIAAADQ